MSDFESEVEIHEFLEQVDYALSSKFTEKWRHRFSPHFISIFQEYLLKAMQKNTDTQNVKLMSSLGRLILLCTAQL